MRSLSIIIKKSIERARESVRSMRHMARTGIVRWGGVFVAIGVASLGWLYYAVEQPPQTFPVDMVVTIPEGVTAQEAANILKDVHVIHSAFAFRVALALRTENARTVLAGDYYFKKPETLSQVVQRITAGDFALTPVRVVVPEGATTYDMARLFPKYLPKFDPVLFALLTQDKEGYLFPDTYLFPPNADTRQVVDALEQNFYKRFSTLEPLVASSGRSVHDIITMASLLEKEASDFEQKRRIAGILWHRIDIGMPLQVDAVFGYINGTHTFNPTYSDLKVESPYNTYKYAGLPPGPIGNPSLSSIEAALSPIPSDALFYLHGTDGALYVSKTYKEHLVKKRRYLN